LKFLLITLSLALFSPALTADEPPAVGSAAPCFNLQDQNGDWHALEDYRGEWLAIYFYPKDDTPGCTTEACNFRDSIYAFEAIGAHVIGISLDDVESHREFAEKFSLPFILLADVEGDTARAYGVLHDFKLVKMARRESFIVDPAGKVARHYADVDPDTHTAEVLSDLQELMKPAP
jgi:peroxiredoxin Q/BCP